MIYVRKSEKALHIHKENGETIAILPLSEISLLPTEAYKCVAFDTNGRMSPINYNWEHIARGYWPEAK